MSIIVNQRQPAAQQLLLLRAALLTDTVNVLHSLILTNGADFILTPT